MLYITKYALTRGIVEVPETSYVRVDASKVIVGLRVYTIGHSIFTAMDLAVRDCEARRSKKIEELNALTFGGEE